MGHENYFTEDFQSEDEDSGLAFDLKANHALGFMPEAYDDVQSELIKSRFHEEVGVQCEFQRTVSLTELMLMPAMSCSETDKVLVPNQGSFGLTHTARAFFPVMSDSPHSCKHCGQGFKTASALNGHVSRKH
jgi:hypothetical protein